MTQVTADGASEVAEEGQPGCPVAGGGSLSPAQPSGPATLRGVVTATAAPQPARLWPLHPRTRPVQPVVWPPACVPSPVPCPSPLDPRVFCLLVYIPFLRGTPKGKALATYAGTEGGPRTLTAAQEGTGLAPEKDGVSSDTVLPGCRARGPPGPCGFFIPETHEVQPFSPPTS